MVIPKSMIEWIKEESKESGWNIKGLYNITKGVNTNKYNIIKAC